MGLFDFLKKTRAEMPVPEAAERLVDKAAEGKSGIVDLSATKEPVVVEAEIEASAEPLSEAESKGKGWAAITAAFEATYPGQKTPRHLSTNQPRTAGGTEPIDAISVYDGGDYWHFVTYGLSDIYDEGFGDNPELSGYGMEFTYKLKKHDDDVEEEIIIGSANLIKALANLTVEHGEIFGPYEYLYTGQTVGIDTHQKSALTGFICVPDLDVQGADTPNGRVDFIEFVGMTDAELKSLTDSQSVQDLYNKMPRRLTDYYRQSLV